ncbi:hypothetical protein REPUB_Repub11eG0036600 [Reevesia pubescens]
MHVTRCSNASYMWQSLLKGRDIISIGAHWRVGDGYQLDIWRDKWLCNPPSYKVTYNEPVTPTPMRVASLIDEDTRCWKVNEVMELFEQNEAEMILTTPLSRTSCPDTLIWSSSETGMFTVRSAYYVARAWLGKPIQHPSSRSPIWRWLWMANVLPKTKLFMWKVFHNILPTTGALWCRGISVAVVCSVCEARTESSFHILFDCPLSKMDVGFFGTTGIKVIIMLYVSAHML